MSQKRNKIIVLVSVILVMICFVLGIKYYTKLGVFKKTTSITPIDILNNDCLISDDYLISICSHSLLNKAIPLGNINFNPKNPSALKPGDFIIIKLNPNALFNNSTLYTDVQNKLTQQSTLCFKVLPELEEQHFLPQKDLIIFSKSSFCLPNFNKNSNVVIAFTGYVPYPIGESKFSIQLWSTNIDNIKQIQKTNSPLNLSEATLLYVLNYDIKD